MVPKRVLYDLSILTTRGSCRNRGVEKKLVIEVSRVHKGLVRDLVHSKL